MLTHATDRPRARHRGTGAATAHPVTGGLVVQRSVRFLAMAAITTALCLTPLVSAALLATAVTR